MGNDYSVVSQESARRFRKMVKWTMLAEADKVERYFDPACANIRLTRSAYLAWCATRATHIASIRDSRNREHAQAKAIREENLYLGGYRKGEVVQGDTLLHVAARRRATGVVQLLLRLGSHEDIRNNNGEIPADLVPAESLEGEMLRVYTAVRRGFGQDSGLDGRLVTAMKRLRRVFRYWHVKTSMELTLVTCCLLEIQPQDHHFKAFSKLLMQELKHILKQVDDAGRRHARELIDALGSADEARNHYALMKPSAKMVVLRKLFRATETPDVPEHLHEDRGRDYRRFLDHAMPLWILKEETGRVPVPRDADAASELDWIWRDRLAPQSISSAAQICTSVPTLESYVALSLDGEVMERECV